MNFTFKKSKKLQARTTTKKDFFFLKKENEGA